MAIATLPVNDSLKMIGKILSRFLRIILTSTLVIASLVANNSMAMNHGQRFWVNQTSGSPIKQDADHDELRIIADDAAEALREVQRIRQTQRVGPGQ